MILWQLELIKVLRLRDSIHVPFVHAIISLRKARIIIERSRISRSLSIEEYSKEPEIFL